MIPLDLGVITTPLSKLPHRINERALNFDGFDVHQLLCMADLKKASGFELMAQRNHSDSHDGFPHPNKPAFPKLWSATLGRMITLREGASVLKRRKKIVLKFINLLKKRSVMCRRNQRSAFDQVSEFDRGGIVAYRDCGLSFREIGSRVGRNQTTVMRICDRWTQEVKHLSATPRWSDSCLETLWREDSEHLRYALPHWSCSGYYGTGRYWISLSHSSSTHCRYFKHSALHLRGIGASCPSLPSGLGHSHIFQQDNARPHIARIVQRFFVNHQIELFPWPTYSPDLSLIENMWFMVAQRLTQITTPAATPDQLWQHVEAAWSAVPPKHIQSLFESMPRRVAISNNDGYSGY
ncbi:transposable element Tcb1 transposase [Trichonephila clavipes]|uniref:Transposable element Tcb1 transposase n=1 Tax=Trichonephila clavipes TaxID=2585209 RepID=A0A8X6RUE5_TRICX|nr:transposable element Tcb1 transposase [Trichonephila clavipes]